MSTADFPLFVTYFTVNTPYEARASRLKKSLDRLGLDSQMEGLPTRGSWVENCAQKAEFVHDIWHRSDRAICWLDADAEMLARPQQLAGSAADLAVVARKGWSFYGGQIMFGKTPGGEELVTRWRDYAVDYPQIWDQVTLGYAWWDQQLATGCSVDWLPETIMCKSSHNPLKAQWQKWTSTAPFFHAQESRKSKSAQASLKENSGRTEFGNADLPEWWKTAAVNRAPFALNSDQKIELGLVPHLPIEE